MVCAVLLWMFSVVEVGGFPASLFFTPVTSLFSAGPSMQDHPAGLCPVVLAPGGF